MGLEVRAVHGTDRPSVEEGIEAWTRAARALLGSHFDRLPGRLGSWCNERYAERTARAGARLMWGEAVPLLLGDACGAARTVPSRLTIPWLLLYAHALFVDDTQDMGRPGDEAILCDQLKKQALEAWRPEFDRDPRLQTLLAECHCRMQQAVLADRDLETSGLSGGALRTLAAKSALVHFGLAAMRSAASEAFPGRAMTAGLSQVCAAVQVLDDLADMQEDLPRGRSQWLVNDARQRLRLKGQLPTTWSPDLTECIVLAVGTYSDACAKAISLLQEGRRGLGIAPCTTLWQLIERTARRTEVLRLSAEGLRRSGAGRSLSRMLRESPRAEPSVLAQQDILSRLRELSSRLILASN